MAVKAELPKEDQLKQLDVAVAALNKQWGKNSIMKMSSEDIEPWPSISTGAYTLDDALGIGGLPRGRVVEIFGPESSGKTTLALSVIAEAQRRGEICVFVDVEHALDLSYAKALGVNVDELYIAQPDTAEAALNMVDGLVGTGVPAVVVLDSVAGLVPRAELEGDVGDHHVGLVPRLMGQTLRKVTYAAKQTNTLVIFINQIREKIGVMFGSPETQPGGRALKFFSSVRIDIRKIETTKNKETGEITGVKTKAKIIKNKMAPPYREAQFQITYGEGIDAEASLVSLALTKGIITKGGGGWISRDGDSYARSEAELAERLQEDSALREEFIRLAVKS